MPSGQFLQPTFIHRPSLTHAEELNSMEIEELQHVMNGKQILVDGDQLEEELEDLESDEDTQDETENDSNRSASEMEIINAGVAGCCTGLALSFPGAPQALMQSCLTFGAFSFIMEGLNKQQPALALCLSSYNGGENRMKSPMNVLPPFTLPFPPNLMEGFSTFCKCLSKPDTAPGE